MAYETAPAGYVGRHRAPHPVPMTGCPDLEDLIELDDGGTTVATDGCWIEADGECEHGFPSWLAELGLI